MPVFLGLDCGGSSSRALAIDEGLATLFQRQSGPANIASTPEPRLAESLAKATEGCPTPQYVCGCFAGLLSPDDRERAEARLRELFPTSEVRAEPDYAAALAASAPGTDICVIAGTGSLVCSRTAGGLVKSGGRGYLLGDEGSAFQFGRDAVVAYLNLGGQASVNLRGAVVKLFGAEDESNIVGQIYRSGAPAPTLARLAKALATDAIDGVPYAAESVVRHMDALAGVVEQHVVAYFGDSARLLITLAGGLWQTSSVFRSEFDRQLERRMPSVRVETVRISDPPVLGAALLAKEMACVN